MSQIIINNGDSGLTVRNNLNSMFTELYGALIVPLKIPGINANYTQSIPANTYISKISLTATGGTPLVRIGTYPNGNDLMDDTIIGNSQIVNPGLYCGTVTPIYITISGPGAVISARFDVSYNYY